MNNEGYIRKIINTRLYINLDFESDKKEDRKLKWIEWFKMNMQRKKKELRNSEESQ